MASTDSGNNVVILCGKVIRAAETRVLPSGDKVAEFRISVPRASGRRRATTGVVDWFNCAAWTATARRAVERWQVGDIVELTGSLRTRHYVVGGSGRTAFSVEVRNARRVERAGRPRGDGAQSGRAQGSRRTTGSDP
jgi:single-strand DNA-binding protein